MEPMAAKTRQLRNRLVITLVTLTILPLLLWLVPPTDALANHIKPSSGTWTPACGTTGGLACMPEGREGAATTQSRNQIIVTHGSISFFGFFVFDTNDTRIYDIPKDTWSNGAPAPSIRSELAGASNGHLHYAVGGRNINFDPDPSAPCANENVCANLEVYDPVKDSWTTLPSMPTPRAGLAAAVVGHKLYAIGGRDGAEPGEGTALNCLEAYDIDAATWSPKCGDPGALAPMPQAAMDVAAIAQDGKIYVIGGASGPDVGCPSTPSAPSLLNNVQIYNVANDTWSPGTMMPSLRANLALATCGSVILALGGRIGPACLPFYNRPTVEAYEIPKNDWTGGLNPMPNPKSEHGAISHGGVVHVLGSGIFGNPQDFHEALTCSSLFRK